MKPSLDMVKILVRKYTNSVKAKDIYGWVALHCAGKCGHITISKYIVDKYPEALLVKSHYGYYPKDISHMFCNHPLRDYLLVEEETLYGKRGGNKVLEKTKESKVKENNME